MFRRRLSFAGTVIEQALPFCSVLASWLAGMGDGLGPGEALLLAEELALAELLAEELAPAEPLELGVGDGLAVGVADDAEALLEALAPADPLDKDVGTGIAVSTGKRSSRLVRIVK